MKLNKIKTFEALRPFLPKLKELYDSGLDNFWEADSWIHFCELLLEAYTNDDLFFGDIVDGEVMYFMGIKPMSPDHAHYWLLFANTKFRDKTKQAVLKSLDILKSKGYHKVTFTTKRMTSSYDRWVTKNFNAKLTSKTYQIDL